jgi:5-methylcytosine-specific restriction endonuclease McrA
MKPASFRREFRDRHQQPAHEDTSWLSRRTKRLSQKKTCELRDALLGFAQDFECCYCRKTFLRRFATLEHVIPLAAGGTYAPENLAIACSPCNAGRNILVTKIMAGARVDRILAVSPHLALGIVLVGEQYCFETWP